MPQVCKRCEEWRRLDLGSICPDCDARRLRVAEAIFDASIRHVGRHWPRWANATNAQRLEALACADAAIRKMHD